MCISKTSLYKKSVGSSLTLSSVQGCIKEVCLSNGREALPPNTESADTLTLLNSDNRFLSRMDLRYPVIAGQMDQCDIPVEEKRV